MTPTWLALVWLAHAAPAPCSLGPPGQTVVQPEGAARVMFELRVGPDTPPSTVDATLAPLLEIGVPVTILIPVDWNVQPGDWHPPSSRVTVGLLTTLDGLVGHPVDDPSAMSFADWRDALRAARKALQKKVGTRPRVLAMPPPPPMGEVAIDDAGFTALLPIDPGNTSPPRRAIAFGGRSGRTRVIWEGSTVDACGAELGQPVRSALDRVARIGPSQPATRVALPPSPDHARALALWWTTVAEPAGWRAWTVGTAALRLGTASISPRPTVAAPPPSVQISVATLADLAPVVALAHRLPRVLPGELTLTAAFAGLTAWAAAPTQTTVSVAPLGPPPDVARSTLQGPTPVRPEDLYAAAEALHPALTGTVPSVVTVGPHTLTCGEFLVALAMLLDGKPPVARPVQDPDPFAVGAGWGAVRLD